MDFTGRTVLVTGANNPRGIGMAIVKAFARAGARVGLLYYRIPPETFGLELEDIADAKTSGDPHYHYLRTLTPDAAVQALEAEGCEVAAREADLTQFENIPAVFDWCESRWGSVDYLLNVAAICFDNDTIFSADPVAYQRTFQLNVGATYLLTAEYAKRYQQHQLESGTVVNFSTDAAQTFAGQVLYGASKAAIEALTRSTAIELGPLGIRVNAIAPGPVQTGYIPDAYARNPRDIPLGRVGSPEDIAHSALFLCSEQAAWVTGQIFQVSGGHAPLR